jgi:lambda family phage minor tail protein L
MAVVDIHQTIQNLEAGNKVKLIEVDCTEFGGSVLRFHNYNVDYTEAELLALAGAASIPPKAIMFQGKAYSCWPYELTGMDQDGTGSSPTPTLTVANLDGTISSMCLQLQNLFEAKVTEHTTFLPYLDGNSDADPTMEFTQTWYISRKSNEDNVSVSWDLSSPADLTGQQLPRRQIHSMCHWALNGQYRGADCGYTGTNYFTDKGVPTANPALDVCGGLCSDCKLRFGAEQPLNFGGFIASSLIA